MKFVVAALAVLFVICSVNSQLTCENALYKNPPTNSLMSRVMPIKEKQHQECRDAGMCPEVVASQGPASCVGGMAGVYPCNNVDLVSFVSLSDLGSSGNGNDIWGWTDPAGGNEIVIACCEDGTSFVDISNPTSPVVLGYLPTETTSTVWRDAKVYKNHAYIVSEAADHGMQVIDLTSLRSLYGNTNTKPVTLSPLTVYTGFGSAHNIVINEESGYAYAVGTKVCDGGLHVVDISDPANPVCAGCYWQDGYVHDAQCINYVNGPDANFNGKEICFCYNEDTLTIVDVTNKLNMVEVARVPYSGSQYTHQGWLSEDMTHLFMNDELDEVEGSTGGPTNGQNTRTLIWDVTDLTKPVWVNTFFSERTVIDHNLYVNNTLVFEANYCGGLRILRTLKGLPGKPPLLREVGFFDVAPNCDEVRFFGAWSNYPYFGSGNIVVQSIERGLFVVKPTRYIA